MSTPGFNDELRDSIRALLQAQTRLNAEALDAAMPTQHAKGLWDSMAALGWFGLATPEVHGGLGLGLSETAILYQELGRYLTPLPVMPTILAAHAICVAGNATQQALWLPAIASGSLRLTLALPSDAKPIPTLNSGGSVTGVVSHVLFADQAGELLIPLGTSSGELHLAIFGSRDSGIKVERRDTIDVTRTLADVHLDNARAGADRLLPVSESQWAALLDHACVALACDSIGGAAHILQRTCAYMETRKQFGRTIGSFQALKHRAASWKILLESVTALTGHAAELVERGDPGCSASASMAKYSACDAYSAVAGDAVQLHGGIGFTWAHECHLFLKRAQLNAELFGCSVQHRDRVAELAFEGALGPPSLRRRLLTTLGDVK